jgi:hypothetical protein
LKNFSKKVAKNTCKIEKDLLPLPHKILDSYYLAYYQYIDSPLWLPSSKAQSLGRIKLLDLHQA